MNEAEFNKIFAAKLKYYLARNNMSQAELATKLGVGTTSVYNWCSGLKTPRMNKVDQMCEIFGISRSALITSDYPDDSKEQDPLTEEEENLIQGSKEPPISVRKAIERVGDFQMNGWKKKGPRGNYCKTMPSSVSFEGYMNKLGSLSLVKYSLRLQILAQGFLDAFYGKVPLILP